MREGRTEKISRMRSEPASSTVRGGWERTRVDQVSWKKRRLMEVEMEVLDWMRSKGRAGRESRVESIVIVFANTAASSWVYKINRQAIDGCRSDLVVWLGWSVPTRFLHWGVTFLV